MVKSTKGEGDTLFFWWTQITNNNNNKKKGTELELLSALTQEFAWDVHSPR